ncbi:amino acid ABC transporter permease [Arenibaculum pallidiluteum]|uniref:amino acid ABC transporter permease n=1 Tax=Arenibaculum pallidiluteum TaxID=2812559 RepID=UPI001A9792F7|nr:amino acid ABC transporter permease [Arenibaculum pallidiluteum]
MAETGTAPGATPVARPPALAVGPLGWLRTNLFSSWGNTLLTLLILWGLWRVVPPLFDWLVTSSLVNVASSQECRGAGGACWAFVAEKWRFIIFGTYPADEQWRPSLAVALIIGMMLFSTWRGAWRPWLGLVWLGGTAVVLALLWGGFLGMTYVSNELWGGLPLTLLLTVIGLGAAFPLAVLLALGRRSDLPAVKAICVGFIELVRGVPLISILFMASVMFPLFMPAGVTVDKLLRAQIGLILFAAAYQAEVVRGGLQAIPKGQYEAADSLGLSYWQKMRKIILPQALALVIPPMVNTFISFLKDTSLVIIIGLFDLLSAAKAALTDPAWRGFYKEAYLFAGLIYFFFCFFMSRYSQRLEVELNRSRRR